jgi:hypothetical protein
MALQTNILKITLDGTGTEIPTLNISTGYDSYLITGTAISTGNYAIVPTGVPQLGDKFVFEYNGTLDITTNGNTFALFGQSITQAQLLKIWTATYIYNGSSWDVTLQLSLGQSDVISSNNIGTGTIVNSNIANNTIDISTKAVNLSVTTAKINDLAVTTAKIDNLAVTDAKVNDVDGSKLAAASVTNAKLATMADQTIKGNISGGAAVPSDIAISTIINSNSWGLTGNSGTTAGTNFVGTTDAVDLVFKANSVEAGRIGLSLGNTSFGSTSLDSITTGTYNTAFGYKALTGNTTGIANNAIGHQALLSNLNGNRNNALGNTALGSVTSGSYNVGIGDDAGNGVGGGTAITSGSNNVVIGYQADVNSASAINRIALGSGALANADYQFALPDNVTDFKFRGNSFTLPSADGAANTALVTDGSGNLSFGNVITSGTYTPTLTNVTNVDASTAYACQYTRIGNMVTVSGKVTIDPNSTSATELGMTLPIASNLANEEELAGTAADNGNNNHAVRIKADATNNRAAFVFTPSGNGSADYAFMFMYQII